jgi:hypothetical protein
MPLPDRAHLARGPEDDEVQLGSYAIARPAQRAVDDRQLLFAGVRAIEIAVDRRLSAIDAGGQQGDRLAHQPLGMVDQRLAGHVEI